MSKKETVYLVRTCQDDLSAHGGFVWPKKGPVSCSDWSKRPQCGQGLHGLYANAEAIRLGKFHLSINGTDKKWLVVEVEKESIVDLGDKVKFPKGNVKFSGNFFGAMKWLNKHSDTPIDTGDVAATLDFFTPEVELHIEKEVREYCDEHLGPDFLDRLRKICSDKTFRYYRKLLRNKNHVLTLKQGKNIGEYVKKVHPWVVLQMWSYVQHNNENVLTLHRTCQDIIMEAVQGTVTTDWTEEMHSENSLFSQQEHLPKKYRFWDERSKCAKNCFNSYIGR